MLPDLGDGLTAYFKGLADGFGVALAAKERVEVVPTFVPAAQINSEIEFELEHNLTNSHDGWVLDPIGMGSIYNFNGFQDLSRVTVSVMANETDVVGWSDVLPFFRNTSTYYDAAIKKLLVVTMPLDGNMRLLYYRADVFAQRGMAVPRTWEEVLDLAQAANASQPPLDLDGNNSTVDYAFCFERRRGEKGGGAGQGMGWGGGGAARRRRLGRGGGGRHGSEMRSGGFGKGCERECL